jgi:predicted dinucleotide-binding enzyme
MNIGIFGTGVVAQTLGERLQAAGHAVVLGTRDPAQTLARSEPDMYGNPPFAAWQAQRPAIGLGTLAEAAAHGEMLLNATNGAGSLAALTAAGEANLNGKILMDIANPLDFSRGMPPSLGVANTDSLGEQIQRAFPALKVVKTLNTMNARVMAYPREVADGDHHVFVSGNDAEAKARVSQLLRDDFGWRHVIDLGDISTARGTEMYLPLWLRLWGALGNGRFNIRVVIGEAA